MGRQITHRMTRKKKESERRNMGSQITHRVTRKEREMKHGDTNNA